MRYEDFLRVLEEIGLAAWHGDGRSTTVREIEEHCQASGVGILLKDFQEGAKAGVTRLLAAFLLPTNTVAVLPEILLLYSRIRASVNISLR